MWFTFNGSKVQRCSACGLVLLNPQPDDLTLDQIYGEAYFIGSEEDDMQAHGNALKRETAKLQLREIGAHLDEAKTRQQPLKLLEVGCGLGNFLVEARNAGYEVQGIDVSADAVAQANAALGAHLVQACHLENARLEPGSYDILVLADVVEHVRDPMAFMKLVHGLLKPGGIVFVAVPSLDSVSARLMRRHWMEFKLEHLYYFNRQTMTMLLEKAGFGDIAISPGRKVLSTRYIIAHFAQFPVPLLTPALKGLERLLPKKLNEASFNVVASGINVLARSR